MWLWISVILYVLGAVGDNLFTYRYVVIEQKLFEANPFTAPRIYTQPLWVWFVYDFIALALTLVIAYGIRRLLLWLSRNDPPPVKARIAGIASKYWVIIMVVGIVRFLPVIHNLLLLLFGYESPLSIMVYELGRYMGVTP